MRVVVPFGGDSPKTRLAPFFDADERRDFALAMLRDVLDAVESTGNDPVVLTDRPVDVHVPTILDDRPLTDAVNDQLGGDDPIAVVMADLALATPASLTRLFEMEGDVVAAPGLGGGTNALVVRTPEFVVDYHGASIADHREIADDIGVSFVEIDSMRLAVDIDEPSDLVEILLHGRGRTREWLDELGVTLDTTDGRAEVVCHRR
ncbi:MULTISPECIES: 2-phospho-L-lactate guanylyltransferase [Haloferax]|uniref:2-phospho-L-lactate guanylyltransferase n=1 Tax=Haloferax marinum TaxID=2666143 RepID=A0A6A8GAR0_9EURY|nr:MULTISPECIES: 2-phospho-L-lactate guanylyltransferase [Haloferax]KAB1198261.1 2-phospho-L-lactate guanylyltransferase [Haloferax sp. CBA1150]MRW97353.1 2-phospho-L-lactate guanylyltransferase [Haloferax marinum]